MYIKRNCYLSVDIEEDLTNNLNKKTFKGAENLSSTLDIFKKHNIKATFFVTGEVLEKYPHHVKEWSKNHEIACHGYKHIPLYKIPYNEREEQMSEFISLYENIFDKKPIGFRAVQHTIDNYQMRILEKFEFKYDSSVIPHYPFFKKGYIGFKGHAPVTPYFPSKKNYRKQGEMNILEIPTTGLVLGFPLAGTWLRNFGSGFYKILIEFYKPKFLAFSLHSWDGIAFKGPHSRNSGKKFLEYLDAIIKLLKEYYSFETGIMIAREFRNK
ncbi:putative xylanase/chitin deacetylase [Thermoplasmatales archaeon SCGC AB-539-C06]|nr:putative xylanase/chitin deacetylase [Thermoplasmatales archaeon SCGC AB-539-C06]